MDTIRLAARYMRPYRGRYLTGFAALLAASFLAMLPPVVLGNAIDRLAAGLNEGGIGPDRWDLVGYGAIFVGLAAGEGFLRFTSRLHRMRDPSVPLQRVHSAADLVGATPFIERLPNGFEQVLAERGADLSTGQKQLLSLARVAAFNPEIVLVMDEATASIDPETEAALQASIRRVTAGRTAILIAHRLNTVRFADRILVLQRGQVIEEGTHADLIAQRGIYRTLFELQYKDQEGIATR